MPTHSQGCFNTKADSPAPAIQKPLKSLPGPKLDATLQDFKPCCAITSIDESKGIIEARDNKTGQTITIQTSHLADFLNQVLDDANKVKDIVVVVAIVGLVVASSG